MIPRFFDAHTHLNMLDKDPRSNRAIWREVGRRTIDNGIWFVNVGADEKSSSLALEQVKELGKGAWATAGVHPTEGGDSNFDTIAKLARDPKVVAIGECGLEYFKLEGDVEREKEQQKELFKKHIELALELGKPLMIHCRPSDAKALKGEDAYDDLYKILKIYKDRVGDKLQFNMHFFTSDWPTAQKFLELDGYLSFPGVITFTSQYDEVVRNVPLDRIMAETDAPFASPVPYRGQRNEPAYVSFVTERIAELRSEPREKILVALTENAKKFYSVDKNFSP